MRSLGAKLMLGLTLSLAGVFLWLGSANLRVMRQNLEAAAVLSAESMADVIFRSTRHSMLQNNRTEQIEMIQSLGAQPGVHKVRIFAKTGAIHYSTLPEEIGHMVDQRADACYACHSSSKPLEKLNSKNTFRIYRIGQERVIGLIRPIENEKACSDAACHSHPPTQRILGVLDVVLSLESADRSLAEHERRMRAQVLFSAAFIIGLAGLVIWFMINRPVRVLTDGVHALASGQLSYRISLPKRSDEIGRLAESFNQMAAELDSANRTLEDRIKRKTRELETAREKLIHSEKLASLGELSAAVAHELNNPLAGILTYSKLLEKKLNLALPALDWIHTIQHESRRCGDIVNNLLVFARKHNTDMVPASIKTIVDRTVAVSRHKLEMSSIELQSTVAELPDVVCDASQIEQVLLAIIMNAVDAIGRNGKIRIEARAVPESRVDISVTNNGPPISAEAMPHLFEPFFSTKQESKGVGLGLAVAYGIMKRHGGDIEVETGAETTFHVLLPLGRLESSTSSSNVEDANARREMFPAHR